VEFEKEYIMRCSFAEWIARNGWKGQFWGLHYCLSKLRSLLSFFLRYDVTQ